MDHSDHVALIKPGILNKHPDQPERQVWAELGSGRGAFTLALAEVLGAKGRIISVDKEKAALQAQERNIKSTFPRTQIEYIQADFTQPIPIGQVDGILMANSLHFVRDKLPFLKRILGYQKPGYLKPGGRFILVEYDVDNGNYWVPYPLSFPSWKMLSLEIGFVGTQLLATKKSSFLGRFYSALSFFR